MPFDFISTAPDRSQLRFDFDAPRPKPMAQISTQGRATNYHAGLSAEATVLQVYQKRGAVLLEQRWRQVARKRDLKAFDEET